MNLDPEDNSDSTKGVQVAANILVTPQTVFRLSSSGAPGEVQLTAEEWRVIAQLNGERTISDVAANLKKDSGFVAKTADDLYRLGLLAVGSASDEPARTTMDGAFFEFIEGEFVKKIGPFGLVLIEDEVVNLGESRDSFPRDKVAALVEHVSEHITDEAKRIDFQRIMLEAIRKT